MSLSGGLSKQTWTQTLLANILKQGPVPQHIAVIMDGNRRYAKRMNLGSVTEGHKKGDQTLYELVDVLQALGIPELSVYAFSLENFKRTKEEVDGLMMLFEERARKLEKDLDKLMEKGIRIEVVGDYTLAATHELRRILARLMWATRENKRHKLNFCFAYTSRSQIAKGLTHLLTGLRSNELQVDDLSEQLLEATFTLGEYRPVDLLVRTSGETRLSDFMLWEASNAYVEIVDKDWPEFDCMDVLKAILKYQANIIFHGLSPSSEGTGRPPLEGRATEFLGNLRNRIWKGIEKDL